VWRKNFKKAECAPLGSKRLLITGSNVAQHWRHSKNRRHFRFGPRSGVARHNVRHVSAENGHGTQPINQGRQDVVPQMV